MPGTKYSGLIATVAFALGGTAYAKGFVYVQANEVENKIIVFKKNDDGTLTRMPSVPTGGKGTGQARALYDGAPGPDPLVSANSLIINKKRDRLFVTNGGDNSISVFSVDGTGGLKLIDREPSGGKLTNSLAYSEKTNTLYVGHFYGPNHIKVMKLMGNDLKLQDKAFSIDTKDSTGRGLSQVLLDPASKHLVATAVTEPKKSGRGVAPVARDGLAILRLADNGMPESVKFAEAGGVEPFASGFIGTSKRFVTTYAYTNAVGLNQLNDDGTVKLISIGKTDDSAIGGKPFEYCWLAFSPDNRFAYVPSTGTGDMVSFEIKEGGISVAKQGMEKVTSATDVKSGSEVLSSTPVDVWASDDGYLYQIYGAAGKLGAFKMTSDGGLKRIALYDVPVFSTQGIDGF